MDGAYDADGLRRVFDGTSRLTVGIEEEVMLLDPDGFDLAPRGAEVLAAAEGDPCVQAELPAAQLELTTPACRGVPELIGHLAEARAVLEKAGRGLVRPAGAGLHPFADARTPLSAAPRYQRMVELYGEVARQQAVFALQVHVAVGSAAATLPVHDALRSYLPCLAALAANAPFHDGRDTGMASYRPRLAGLLPRQGVPPPLRDWETYAEALRFAGGADGAADPRRWWWELRPNVRYGTLEVRVCDTQSTLPDSAAIAAVVHCLVARLLERHEAGEPLAVHPAWRIDENRWSANRHGMSGAMIDLDTGEISPTRRVLRRLLDDLGPLADRLGCADELRDAARLAEAGGADRQRTLAEAHGLPGMLAVMADEFLAR